MAKCSECGAAVADESKFCGYCGAKVNIVSEHLGTQILGKADVILGALERMAPGAVEQYTVLGTATDGPLAGGLILCEQSADKPYRFLWSDGEKLTEVAYKHVDECFEQGTLEFSLDLVKTCKECLTTFHLTRGVWSLHLNGSGVADFYWNRWGIERGPEAIGAASPFFVLRDVETCPTCAAEYLQRDEWLLRRETSFKKDLEVYLSYFSPERVAAAKRGAKGPGYRRAVVRENMAEWKLMAEASGPLFTLMSRLAQELPICMDRDLEAFRAFADSLPGLLLKPTASAVEWRDYQTPFSRLTGSVCIDFHPCWNNGYPPAGFDFLDWGSVYVPYSMYESPSVRELVGRTPNASFGCGPL